MKYEEGESMAEYWKCKTCGRINYGYVGTCGCGGLKADGIQASEEDYKREQGVKDEEVKKKWQCPNCLKINEGDFCACGYVKSRSDKYIDENTYSAQQTYTRSGNKKKIAIIIAVIIGLIIGGNYMISGSFGIGGSKIEGTYISYGYNQELARIVLKDGKYKFYLLKDLAGTGSYKYDKNTNKITFDGMDGAMKEFYYGKDIDGKEYICRKLDRGYGIINDYYYKR